jgi:short-subunit dehydrogenase
MSAMKRIVIVGATSSIAQHCARLWMERAPAELTLAGRDAQRLARVAADLSVRSPDSQVRVVQVEFNDGDAIEAAVERMAANGEIDIVLIAHGSLPDQAQCEGSLMLAETALQVNAVSPVLFAEAFARRMAAAGRGTIAIVGSVAGDRGRKSNYVYGAAKGLVTRYAQGLQHRFAGTGVKVVLIKPGPTDTPMTAHMKAQGAKLAPVQEVARGMVAAIDRGRAVAYVPGKWWLIMQVIRHLPAFVFNRMNI